MLYSCCQDDRVIDIPTKLWLMISDNELNRLCTEGNGAAIGSCWYGSYLETNGKVLSKEEIEEEEEQEYENEDTDVPDLNIDESYWE